jgi:hypothetical protein
VLNSAVCADGSRDAAVLGTFIQAVAPHINTVRVIFWANCFSSPTVMKNMPPAWHASGSELISRHNAIRAHARPCTCRWRI